MTEVELLARIGSDIQMSMDLATDYGRHQIDESLRQEIVENIVKYWTGKKETVNWKDEGF